LADVNNAMGSEVIAIVIDSDYWFIF